MREPFVPFETRSALLRTKGVGGVRPFETAAARPPQDERGRRPSGRGPGRGADEGGVVTVLDGDVEAADDGGGDTVQFVHDRLGGGSEFIGEGHLRHLEVEAVRVAAPT